MKKTLADIIQSMKDYITPLYPTADVSEGSMISDINIVAPSKELAKMYDQNERVSLDQSIDTASEDGLDMWGLNLNAIRKSAIPATGNIIFYSDNAPTSDIAIAAGTIISTRPTTGVTPVRFRTIRTVNMFASLASTYLNSDTGKYEISTEIEAVTAGKTGVVGTENINTIISPVTGITGCYNASPTAGGKDSETLDEYRRRLALLWRGSVLGTTDGLLSEVLSNDNVLDAVLTSGSDSEREVLGAVDIYIKGSVSQQNIDVVEIVPGDNITELVLSKQPVLDDGTQTIIYGASGSVTPPASVIVKDTAANAGSIYAQDKIVWNTALPDDSVSVFVTYSYNSLVTTLQDIFTKTTKDVENMNILIKEAVEIPIDVTLNIRVSSGFDSTSVSLDVQDAIAEFFSEITIGEEVQQADVARVVLNVSGVDDVLLPFPYFKSTDQTVVPNTFGNLEIPADSYAAAGTILINIEA